jgi:hypothetical protein
VALSGSAIGDVRLDAGFELNSTTT